MAGTPASINRRLVAHRGLAASFIENTLSAITAAAKAGAVCIEVDVQLSRDRVPVLFHDRDLKRLAGIDGPVSDLDCARLQTLQLHQDGRPGPQPIMLLSELVGFIDTHPGIRFFVELKRITLDAVGAGTMIPVITNTLARVLDRCVFISYDHDTVADLKARGLHCGWVLEGPLPPQLAPARALAPDFVFVDIDDTSLPLPADVPWTWVVFEVTDPALAARLLDNDATLVESFDIAALSDSLAAGSAGER